MDLNENGIYYLTKQCVLLKHDIPGGYRLSYSKNETPKYMVKQDGRVCLSGCRWTLCGGVFSAVYGSAYEVIPPKSSVCCFSSILHVVIIILLFISGSFDSIYVLAYKRGEKEGKEDIYF